MTHPSEHPDGRCSVGVRVEAAARLHMGFIDPSGSLGRVFGSIGVGLAEISTRLTIRPADRFTATGPGAERAARACQLYCDRTGFQAPVAITVEQAIPEHVGLGSGTQLALAVAGGLSAFRGADESVRELAQVIDRGARSGIGIGVFEQGGLIVDGGRGTRTEIPPVIVRLPFPAAWRFILVFDTAHRGLHGASEVEAFRRLPPFPAEMSAGICHRLLMRALPALVEGDISGFGDVITDLQNRVGDHFAPAQGGRFTSTGVAAAIAWLAEQGAVAAGQSSWGPTGFCLTADAAVAGSLVERAKVLFPALEFQVVSAKNSGAAIRPLSDD